MPTIPQLKARQRKTRRKEGAVRKAIKRAHLTLHRLHARRLATARQIKRLQRRHGTGVAAALKWGLAQVGTTEHPYGANAGPKIDDWSRAAIGITGVSWCQTFADAVLLHGGGQQLKSGYTVAVVQWARERRYGLRAVPISDRQPGDFVYFKWPGVSRDLCDHVGVYLGGGRTLEGNTSPGTAGSQNNGGCVAIRVRGLGQVVAVVRPTYK